MRTAAHNGTYGWPLIDRVSLEECRDRSYGSREDPLRLGLAVLVEHLGFEDRQSTERFT